MKHFILTLLFFATYQFGFCQNNSDHSYVNGYVKKDGTYVQGHFRTKKNNTINDNFSTKGNFNPYTGKDGWIEPEYLYSEFETQESLSSINSISTNGQAFEIENNNRFYGKKSITLELKDGTASFEITDLKAYCNPKTEYWWYTENKGVNSSIGQFDGYLLNGQYEFKNKQGISLVKCTLKNGILNGPYTISNIAGIVELDADYENGVLKYLRFENKQGETKEYFFRNTYHWSLNTYGYNRVLIETQDNFEGTNSRHFKIYHELNGKLQYEYNLNSDGLYFGEFTEYYPFGKIAIRGNYLQGKPSGIWEFHNEFNSSIKYRTYKLSKNKYKNGTIKSEGAIYFDKKNNKWIKDGKWDYYDLLGNLVKIITYNDGVEVDTISY